MSPTTHTSVGDERDGSVARGPTYPRRSRSHIRARRHRREFVTIIGVLRERAFQDVAEVVIPAH
jgi:hypothetical protein